MLNRNIYIYSYIEFLTCKLTSLLFIITNRISFVLILNTFTSRQTTLLAISHFAGYLGTTATAALANCSLKCIRVQKCQALFLLLPLLLQWGLPASGSRWSQLLMHTRILVASRFTAKFSYSFWPIYSLCLQDDNVSNSMQSPTVCSPPLPPTSACLTAGYSFSSLTTEGRNVV